MRLRSDIWVAAYVRRCNGAGAHTVVERRGAAEAGAIFVKIDRLDGTVLLFGPAPQALFDEDRPDRRFVPLHGEAAMPAEAADARLAKEIRFDSDLWIVTVETRAEEHFLDLAAR